MMNPTIGFFVVMATVFCLTVTGCEKEGPAEKAGKKIDETIEQTTDAVEETVNPKGMFEKAGEVMDEAVEDVKEGAAEVKEDVTDAIEEHQEK
ncbi:hypothetical protein [Desulfuromonas acetoxidans]|uniref:Uncharacterized protein n=1 Tax=Desulfuromonas acetoxidans (strain DSM 684 / 11070) TaxID=281689 RepID=Q1JWZ7_DESA6|nr:hypothetical protein [Desulfuromonas acetoxidans]EAT14761.1 conserved hypothetical protein [Desulfuromonas acetoxidans DSM 684]